MASPYDVKFGTSGAECRAWVLAEAATPAATLNSNTAWSTAHPLEFQSDTNVSTRNLIDAPGFRGTRIHRARTVRSSIVTVGGTITLTPTPKDLAFFLPHIMGGKKGFLPDGVTQPPASNDYAGTAITVGDLYYPTARLPSFAVLIDLNADDPWIFRECVVDTATFSAAAGELISLSLDVVGKKEERGTNITNANLDDVTKFLAIENDIDDTPYVFSDSEDTASPANSRMSFNDLGATPAGLRYIETFSVTVANSVQAGFRNSKFARVLLPQDRVVTLSSSLPWSDVAGGGSEDNRNLYKDTDDGKIGPAELNFVIPQTGGTDGRLMFQFRELRMTAQRPPITAREEVLLPFNAQAFANTPAASDKEWELRILNTLPVPA